MSVTIYDIAERAQVSIATVSRVFNEHPRVSEATRARVIEVAEALNYRPNASAQSLARQATNVVSAVIPVLTNYFYMEVIRGLQDGLVEVGYDLLVYSSRTPEEVEGQLHRALQKGRAEGLLLVSTRLTPDQVQRLRRSKQAIVLVDAAHPNFDSISINNVEGGYLATQHLISQGYRRIGHITVAPPEPHPAIERQQGYEQALREAGLAVDEDLIIGAPARPYGYEEESGYECMMHLLRQSPPPDAVFVATDIQALGALHALREAGLQTPDDVALVGFDDIKISQYVELTTMSQPMYEMGRLAVEKLVARLGEPSRPTSHTVFAPCLVVRGSSVKNAPSNP